MAVGVANPNAQGQLITSTEMAIVSAKCQLAPSRSQMQAAAMAMVITTGTKTPLILSASLAMGALEEVASYTRAIILDKVVSPPMAVASILK